MEVILLERVAKLSQMGEVVKVRDGFARNFLLKRNKAIQDIMREFTGDLEANLIGGVKPSVPGAKPSVPGAAAAAPRPAAK